MKKAILFLILLLSVSLFLAGCGETESEKTNPSSDSEKQLTIYTTVYPLQYFTEEIGGEAVHVETIYPPGSDEHTFDPSQKDMMTLADSDLFIYVGLGLEGFVEKARGVLKNEDVTLLAAGEHIHLEQTEAHNTEGEEHSQHEDAEHKHGDIDPHVWLDPIYAKEMAESIRVALIEQMPEKEEEFTKNYDSLAKKLNELNEQFISVVDQAAHKEMIVSHAAYGYWEARYGVKQISISGLSSSSEPSQKELESIIADAKKQDIKYIFFEQNVSSKLTEIVQNEIGADPLIIHNLSVRTAEDIKDKRNYFSIMDDNLQALKKALY
jgi:zinc transport system substrate-binding protein